MSVPEGCRFELIRSVTEFEAVRPEWERLWWADRRATPFQSPEWLLPWWRSVGEGELCSVALRGPGERLVALLPLYVYTQPENGRRDALLLGAGTSDYLDGLFCSVEGLTAAEVAQRVLLEAREQLHGRADRILLHQLREDSELLRAGRALGVEANEAEPCSIMSTSATAFPAKMRLNLGRYRRRAERLGALEWSEATTPEEAAAALETLIDLHGQRWQMRGETGVLSNSAVQRHHRAAVPLLQQAGLLRMTTLRLDGDPLAVLYCLLDPGRESCTDERRCYAYLIGIAMSQGELSPGSLLLEHALRTLAHEGIGTFDMLRGGEGYKRLWGAEQANTYSMELA